MKPLTHWLVLVVVVLVIVAVSNRVTFIRNIVNPATV
jgi:hypothetical protein